MTTAAVPHERQLLVLEVAGFGRTDARVERASEHHFSLALFLVPGSDFELAGEQWAAIEFTTARGLARIEGVVRALDESVDLYGFERSLDAALVQRRDFVRVDAVLGVRLWHCDDEDDPIQALEPVQANTLSISGNGLLINGASGFGLGDTFWFELPLPDGHAVEGRARFVREAGADRLGGQIEHVTEKSRDRLVRHVFECQRKQRLSAVRGER
ncbi:MAG TPA: PilZ domain-containing protein [Thermoleophilaceae bacterium]